MAEGNAGLAFKTLGGSGADIVLLHGFGSDRLSWLGTSPALMTVGRVHALDLPGHGASDMETGDGSPAALAGLVAASLARHGIERAHLVGHSLGGGIALLLAAQGPLRIDSLALLAPAGLGMGIDQGFLAAFPDIDDIDTALAMMRQLVVRPQLINKMTAERLLAQLRRDGAREAMRRIAGGLANGEAAIRAAAAQVAALHVPRMVIWGDSDAINPPDEIILGRYGGTLHRVAGAGHLPHIEQAKAVNEVLVQFLRDCQTKQNSDG